MTFKMNTALQVCTATMRQRAKQKTNSYVLYYSNDQERYDGKFNGTTLKELMTQFREMGGQYKYAVITKLNDDKPIRFFNRELNSKKFFAMTRNKKTAVSTA